MTPRTDIILHVIAAFLFGFATYWSVILLTNVWLLVGWLGNPNVKEWSVKFGPTTFLAATAWALLFLLDRLHDLL